MDDEYTSGFKEPCAQCCAVDWGLTDEGRFYCRSCHNVIERTKEVEDSNFNPGSSRVSTISSKKRKLKQERGRQWMVCEGFQFILMDQADALVKLGVSKHFKDEVLHQLWMLYLHRSQQAYTNTPIRSCTARPQTSDSDSAADLSVVSGSETDSEMFPPSRASSVTSNADNSDASLYASSVDGSTYRNQRGGTSHLMTMKKTLVLLHLGLVWARQGLTLSDLLRLVNEGHVPYVNTFQAFPEEMKLSGSDSVIFKVLKVPPYEQVHKETENLIGFLQLPAFPPISRQSLLHPASLCLRYLMEVNLPDDLYPWVCELMKFAQLDDVLQNRYDPFLHRKFPHYDVQAVAIIIVTMKFIFGLNDHVEWESSTRASQSPHSGRTFNLRRWYRLLQGAVLRAQRRRDNDAARKQWIPEKLLSSNRQAENVAMKRKRVSNELQSCFRKLTSGPSGPSGPSDGPVQPPSIFQFFWGDMDGADGPSLHRQNLDLLVTQVGGILKPTNEQYWHPALRDCSSCHDGGHYSEAEPTLPRMFVWTLQLFAFVLDLTPALIYREVLRVERRVLGTRTPQSRKHTKFLNVRLERARARLGAEMRARARLGAETRARMEAETKARVRLGAETKAKEGMTVTPQGQRKRKKKAPDGL
ncbi:TATA box-binding protein-associated factor RNA polymerase I subunit B [Sphaeramia orbicularis]|uniref:TATA box-binding protein-associated factor RNA polymerase I subunit B n=1 Tax=Sphaeramia orbicularis TaxID=375764 RepID=A0A672ZK85_9TELE|nr:TATA box-binding protein-associated factor RNA polymerase I subunit B [Sphaeramia orbicularis]